MLTQNQLDALTSFVFNLGEGNFASSTLLKKSNAQDWAGAREEFARWNHAAGKEMPGLTRRRAEEAALFGGSPDEPVTQEKPVLPLLPLLIPLASSLIDAFSPLAREKITKEMGRHTDKPEVAEQIATGIIETVKTLTSQSDPIQAVAQARNDPAIMAQVESNALDTLDRLVGVVERVNKFEREDIDSARRYNAEEPLFLDTPWLKLKFIHILSLVFVTFSAWFVSTKWDSLTAELRGAVITLMVIAGWNGVRDYWMSSSAGSTLKTQLLNRKD